MAADVVSTKGMPADVMARAFAVRDWLVREARSIDDPDLLTEGLAQRLIAVGIPLDRMSSAMPTLYAVRRGLGRVWSRDAGVSAQEFPWNNQAVYEASPYHRAHQTRDWVSFRLDDVSDEDFGIVSELRGEGYTHYVCVPIFFRDGSPGGMTFATRRPGGFSDSDLAVLHAVGPSMAILLDLNRAWRLIHETLSMYVGEEPQSRILSGQVRRGDVVRIRSAIVFADMRGFTALSARMSAEETVELLNRYFDCVVPPIEQGGGQVLKYIGDGVLAIYRAGDDGHKACAAALSGVDEVLRRVADDRDQAEEGRRFDVKVSLHFGEVAYGNIGSGARLDYTVVGTGVNVASRLADLAGNLGRRILVSADFAEMLPETPFRALGEHRLRGVSTPQRVFEPMS